MPKKPVWLARLEYLPVIVLLPLLRYIPYRAGLKLSRMLGMLLYYLLGSYRRIALINLTIAFGRSLPAAQRKAAARGAFINMVQTLFEFVVLARFSAADVARFTRAPAGYDDYKTLVRRGRGVIACSIHFSNWYWTVICAAIEGHKVSVVVRPLDNPYLDRLMNQAFARWGISVIARSKVYPAAVAALRRGETLALMIDQNAAVQGCFVPFFDTPAATMRGLAVLRRGTGAAVVCVHDVREDAYHHAVMTPLDHLPDDEAACLLQLHRYFENVIAGHKELYFWLHARWKTRPAGETSFYPRLPV
jgi:KDO2-lipid IV(A) lauroyltransferase